MTNCRRVQNKGLKYIKAARKLLGKVPFLGNADMYRVYKAIYACEALIRCRKINLQKGECEGCAACSKNAKCYRQSAF
jgi:uncharacterized protein YjaG (DUF416 family)